MFPQNFTVYLCHATLIYSLLAHDVDSTPHSCCKLAPNGTLTLGAAHQLVNGNIQIIPFTGLLGKLSLFRLWRRERSKQEVTSLKCIEGDLVTWWSDDWDTQICAPLRDLSLHCGEQIENVLQINWNMFSLIVSTKVKMLFVSQHLTQVQYFLPHTGYTTVSDSLYCSEWVVS